MTDGFASASAVAHSEWITESHLLRLPHSNGNVHLGSIGTEIPVTRNDEGDEHE